MKKLLAHPLPATPEALMIKASYVRHCVDTGRSCYHRRLNDPPFPRFHAYIAISPRGMEIDLHFDALDSVNHKGNHDQPWAYEGGRVDEEIRRMVQVMYGIVSHKEIYHPPEPPCPVVTTKPKKKRGILDLLFKSM